MSDTGMSGFHLNTGGGTYYRLEFGKCHGACGITDAPLAAAESGSPWYGTTETCTLCGDAWGDELLERPFRPRWRQDHIRNAIHALESEPCNCELQRDWEDGGGYVVPCEHRTAAREVTA